MRTSVRVFAPFVALLLAAACNAPRATSPATSAPSGSAAASTAPSFTRKTLNIANRTLEAYGLDPNKDIQRERLGVQDSANALRDGKIDAFFFSGGLPVPAVLDLSTATKIKVLDLTDSVKKMSDKYGPLYFTIKIPKTTYNTAADVTVSRAANRRARTACLYRAL